MPGPFTSSHTITVKMHTDRSVTRPGFAAEWGTIPDSPVPSCECGLPHTAISTSRIVGGQDAEVNEYPWQVWLLYRGQPHNCGGSIISPRHILTAAHCTYPYRHTDTDFSVVVGEHNTTDSVRNRAGNKPSRHFKFKFHVIGEL